MPTPSELRLVEPPAGATRAASAESDLPAWSESAASSQGYAVPARFLWFADLFMLAASAIIGHQAAPFVQGLVAPGAILRHPWLDWLSLPSAQALGNFRPLSDVIWIPLVMIPATLLSMQVLGGYRQLLAQSRTRLLGSTLVSPLVGLGFVTLVLVALRYERASRAFIFSMALFSAVGLLAYRAAVRAYKRRRLGAGQYVRNAIVVGTPSAASWMAGHIERVMPPEQYRLRGYLDVGSSPDTTGAAGHLVGLPRLGTPDVLGDVLITRPIHEVIAIDSPKSADWLKGVVDQCSYFRITLRIVPEGLLPWNPMDLQFSSTAGLLQLPEVVLRPRQFDSDALFIKRVVDILASAILLIMLSPLFLAIALAIKITTPALPVFYPWRVVGYKGRRFTGYKFTTMVADADERKAELQHLNEMSGPVFKIKDDPRMTPVGRWLRKFSLNELPQLWSVLKGDMSLVGPRPAYPHELARYELWHKRKLCVQPGITCLWQIRGRNQITNFNDWVRMDFEYIDNWSLWLDLRILLRTAWVVLTGTGS